MYDTAKIDNVFTVELAGWSIAPARQVLGSILNWLKLLLHIFLWDFDRYSFQLLKTC